MSEAAIDMRNVEKWYGNVAAVGPLDLSVRQGEFVALLGPSGCGKTTTLRMVAGLDLPTRGDILVRGRRVNDIPVHRRNVGMVFQNLALFPHRSVFDNIAFGLKYRGVSKSDIMCRVGQALQLVRLPGFEGRFPAQLSGGQQQRVAVARAIVIEPDLLLFDEPLSALDATLREEMRIELKRIQRELGITTIFVTHDQSEALAMADRVVVMREGRVEQDGTPEAVYSRPATEFVARFFGYANEVTGVAAGYGDGLLTVKVGEHLAFQVRGLPLGQTTIRMLVRAERIQIGQDFAPDTHSTTFSGTVVRFDYLGMLARYFVEGSSLMLQVVQPHAGKLHREGESVKIRIPEDAWIVLT